VASNSDLKVLTQMLESTSLLGRFTGRIVSAEEKRPKPAPDVYLAAASLMTVSPKDCLAVEDSVSGAQAAAEAGMDVAAFTGIQTHGKAYEQKLREAGAKHHLRTMQDLPSLAASLHLRRTLTAHGIAASRVIVSAAA
jgi:beta-phosphoglucomutase-like phosphatase (HAD superfamily)